MSEKTWKYTIFTLESLWATIGRFRVHQILSERHQTLDSIVWYQMEKNSARSRLKYAFWKCPIQIRTPLVGVPYWLCWFQLLWNIYFNPRPFLVSIWNYYYQHRDRLDHGVVSKLFSLSSLACRAWWCDQ